MGDAEMIAALLAAGADPNRATYDPHPVTRDGHELTVYVSVAPAQGNKTSIQYSLRQQ